jgi:hypothetical protein
MSCAAAAVAAIAAAAAAIVAFSMGAPFAVILSRGASPGAVAALRWL